MTHIDHLQCMICGAQFAPDEQDYVCPEHGREGTLDVVYDYTVIGKQISREVLSENTRFDMWRYQPLLPVVPDALMPPLRVGWTPLYRVDRLAESIGLRHLWLKDDGLQPTASLKDRASAMALVKAAEKQAPVLTTASTGNAAAALSGLCASVGQASAIFVPERAPPAKIAQVLAYGSTVLLVQGTYDDAYALCLEATERYGWYNRSSGFNPYMTEGKKTVAYEICEQLDWQAPDVVFVSVGDGCIIGGVHKGFYDLYRLGWIDTIPRLVGVQAEGSAYLTEAWENNEDLYTKPPIEAHTVADSISAGLPRDRIKALRAVTDTNGAFIRVSDDAILRAIPLMARTSGVLAEPAGSAACAGVIEALAQGLVDPDERIVIINTGSGLKDVRGVQDGVDRTGTKAHVISPDPAALPASFDTPII